MHVASSVGWVLLVTYKDNQPGGKKKNMEQQMNLCNGQKGWCHLELVCHHDGSIFFCLPHFKSGLPGIQSFDPYIDWRMILERVCFSLVLQSDIRRPHVVPHLRAQSGGICGIIWVIFTGKRLHNYGKIHHFSWENPLFLWWFSIVMLVYQRVFTLP